MTTSSNPASIHWEDCCEVCIYESDCEKLVTRCVLLRGKPCDNCNTCEEFKRQWFKKASEIKGARVNQ